MTATAKETAWTHVYAWGNNEKRAQFKGLRCRIVASGAMRTVLVEFVNGERTTTSRRALRPLAAAAGPV